MHRRRKVISPGRMKNLASLIKHICGEAEFSSHEAPSKEDDLHERPHQQMARLSPSDLYNI